LGLPLLQRRRGKSQKLNQTSNLKRFYITFSKLCSPVRCKFGCLLFMLAQILLIKIFDGEVSFIKRNRTWAKLLGIPWKPKHCVNQCIVKGFPYIKIHNLSMFVLIWLADVVDKFVLHKVAEFTFIVGVT
jgi:hypothetical protein